MQKVIWKKVEDLYDTHVLWKAEVEFERIYYENWDKSS